MSEIKNHYLRWGQYISKDFKMPDTLEFKVIDFKIFDTEYSKNVKIKQKIENSWSEIVLPLKSHTSLNGALLYLWIKEKKSTKTYESIQNAIKKNTLEDLMCASNIFGRGLGPKRLSLILETYPDILTNDVSNKDKVGMITEIKGMSTKTAELFVTNIEPFVCFIKEANLSYKIQEVQENKQVINTYHLLYGKKIVMSGFRDKELMGFIKKVGGINENQITKDTFALIIKDLELEGSKKNTAIKQNIPIYSITDFIVKFIKSN